MHATSNRFFVWFPQSRRWVPASPAGAEACYVESGQDVAWGRNAPQREGVNVAPCDLDARGIRFQAFTTHVTSQPNSTHRIATM